MEEERGVDCATVPGVHCFLKLEIVSISYHPSLLAMNSELYFPIAASTSAEG